jgi:type I restriction enzyme S subunit
MIKSVKLSALCKMQSGGTPSRSNLDFYEGDFPWAKISDLEKSDDGYIYKTEEHITQDALQSINNRQFQPGTLLLAMYGSVGKTAITKIHLTTNQAILGINIIDDTILDIKYLKYWFSTIKERLLNRAVGAALPNISLGIVKDLEIPIPPLPQQQKIANILDAADALRQNDKALIAKYDELTQALFLDMFGDPYLNINNWQEKTCGEFIYYLADIGSNGANSVVSEKLVMTDTEDYALMIRTTNLTRNDFSNNIKYVSKEVYDFFKKSQIFGGEIIMNKIGSAGDFWLMPHLNRPVSLGLNQFVIRLKDINTLYFYYFLSTDYGTKNIKSRINGVATKSITKTAVRELPILFPPIELQNQFAERVAVIEEQKAIAQKSLEKSESLFNSLLQKAFKGELV